MSPPGRVFRSARRPLAWLGALGGGLIVAPPAATALLLLLASGRSRGQGLPPPWDAVLEASAWSAVLLMCVGGALLALRRALGRERVVRVEPLGVRVGTRWIPRDRLDAVRLTGAPGGWVEAWAGQTLLFDVRERVAQESAGFDISAHRASAREAASILGIPFRDEASPDADWSAYRDRALSARRLACARELSENHAKFETLRRAVPVEPPVTWDLDGVTLHIPGAREVEGLRLDGRQVGTGRSIPLVRIDRVDLMFEGGDPLVGRVVAEVDGRLVPLVQVTLGEGEGQVGHLVWSARRLEEAVARSQAAIDPGGRAPTTLARLTAAART